MKFIFIACFLLFLNSGFSISNEEIRSILEKKIASVGDAIYAIYSIDNENATLQSLDLKNNPRLLSLKQDVKLDAGALAIIAIEYGKAKGSILYTLTGWSKYAAESLVFQKIFPEYFSWNREISGKELIETVGILSGKEK